MASKLQIEQTRKKISQKCKSQVFPKSNEAWFDFWLVLRLFDFTICTNCCPQSYLEIHLDSGTKDKKNLEMFKKLLCFFSMGSTDKDTPNKERMQDIFFQ